MRAYGFGPFVLDVQERRLLCNEMPVPLTPKVFDTLVYLVERDGRLVGKNELLETVWGGAYVEEGSLPRAVHVLRKTLNAAESGGEPQRQYIETVPTKGYRFVAPVTRVAGNSLPPVAARPDGEAAKAKRPAISGSTRGAVAAVLILAAAGAAWRAVDQHDTSPRPGTSRLSSATSSGAAYARFQSGRLLLERHLPGDAEKALHDFDAAL